MDFRTKVDQNSFGVRATALIIRDNYIFLGKHEDGFHTIGGAIEVGETSSQVALREMQEEIGIAGEIVDLAFVVENQFTADSLKFHNIEFHYIIKPLEEPPTKMVEGKESYPCEWLPLDELDNFDIKPAFLKKALINWDGQLKHIVNKDGED
ncbi:NUDIX hydrolase [Streptococcus pluranimalium]|uniref:NUDIX hydrolase n=1 Tax=Streptococcus pluranimalium TaxID=82348 RepID=UPI002415078B|nr:NUDIX domain-containing protein [Streptococcus pluranimalium]WFM79862.1 NUDIX domain-containing protein [Streptococcus pluranimalium]